MDVVMERNLTEYSIPELQEALASVDERRYPESWSALEAELQARKDSGEFDQYLQEIDAAAKRRDREKVIFARKMRKPIAAYLVVGALYTAVQTGFGLGATNMAVDGLVLMFLVAYLAAMFAGGIGLVLEKSWGYLIAMVVLALQVLKIQSSVIVFSAMSLIGAYVYTAQGFAIGFWAAFFTPEFTVGVGPTVPPPVWVGLNLFAVLLIVLLRRAKRDLAPE